MRRVLIVEDQTIVRDLLRDYVNHQDGFTVVGCVGDGGEAVSSATTLRPDLIILDALLPTLSGLGILRALPKMSPRSKVILLTSEPKPRLVREALDAGAHAIVMKGTALRDLRDAMDRVMEGGSYYCAQTASIVRELFTHPPNGPGISARERQIAQLVASGMSSKQIGQHLSLSVRTVENHRRNLMRKLDIHDVASLTRWAIEEGLIPPTR